MGLPPFPRRNQTALVTFAEILPRPRQRMGGGEENGGYSGRPPRKVLTICKMRCFFQEEIATSDTLIITENA
jgi:hypothetical protein